MAAHEPRRAQYKIDAVNAMTSEFSRYDAFIFTDYRGMKFDQISQLRSRLKEKDTVYRVVKNNFAKIALDNISHPEAKENLVGPTAVVLVKGEEAFQTAAKVLFEFAKEAPLQVKGACLNGVVFDQTQIESYSKLPTKKELIALLMGTMKAPLSKLVRTLQAVADIQEH